MKPKTELIRCVGGKLDGRVLEVFPSDDSVSVRPNGMTLFPTDEAPTYAPGVEPESLVTYKIRADRRHADPA